MQTSPTLSAVILSAAILSAGLAPPSWAQGNDPLAPSTTPTTVKEPPELVRLRETFEEQLAQRLDAPKEAYLEKLKNLEGKRALLGEYEGALRVQRKRKAVGGSLVTAAGETKVAGEIELDLARGRRSGSSLNFDRVRSSLMGFEKAGHHIIWDVMKVKPGLYRVLVTYGCADATTASRRDEFGRLRETELTTGGSFTFEEATNLNTGEDRLLRHSVFPTGGWDKVVTRNIGRLRLTGTTSTLKLTALAPNEGGLMALRKIRLIPYTADEAGVDGGSLSALDRVRTQYRLKVKELTAKEFGGHIAKLKELEESLAAADRIRDALAVKTARIEIERQAAEPAAAVDALTGEGT